MMDYKTTMTVLEHFYECCVAFWEGEGNDEYKAMDLALEDVKMVTCNPFFPNGEPLNLEAKAKFIEENFEPYYRG